MPPPRSSSSSRRPQLSESSDAHPVYASLDTQRPKACADLSHNDPFFRVVADIGMRGGPSDTTSRLKDKVLFLNKPASSGSKKEKTVSQKSRHIKLSKSQLKDWGLFEPDRDLKFADVLPLHSLWKQYIENVIPNSVPPGQRAMRLAQAELHGAFIRVIRSTTPSYIGLGGVVVQETEQAFRVISSDNRHRLLLKAHSVYSVEVNGSEYALYGQHLTSRPAARSKTKFKGKPTVLL